MPQIVMASQWFFWGGEGDWVVGSGNLMGITITCVCLQVTFETGFLLVKTFCWNMFFFSIFCWPLIYNSKRIFFGIFNQQKQRGGFLGMIGQWLFIPTSLKGGERFTFLTWIGFLRCVEQVPKTIFPNGGESR